MLDSSQNAWGEKEGKELWSDPYQGTGTLAKASRRFGGDEKKKKKKKKKNPESKRQGSILEEDLFQNQGRKRWP